MKKSVLRILSLMLVLLVHNVVSLSAKEQGVLDKGSDANQRKLMYKPRVENAPSIRIDGASRNLDSKTISLYVLAPEHLGYTIKEKPTLYWYQSQPSTALFEFVLSVHGAAKPVFSYRDAPAQNTGIQHVRLAEHNVKLSKGIPYSWYVVLIPDTEDRSKDIFASGMIEIIDPPTDVAKSLVMRKKKDLVYVLAEEGIWYDALDAISSLVESNPHDKSLHDLRANLLDQGNLLEVADFERKYSGE